jgi:hypothetical protein
LPKRVQQFKSLGCGKAAGIVCSGRHILAAGSRLPDAKWFPRPRCAKTRYKATLPPFYSPGDFRFPAEARSKLPEGQREDKALQECNRSAAATASGGPVAQSDSVHSKLMGRSSCQFS